MKAKKERNYKDEYKKIQSGGLTKKYRAALNKFNRESEKKGKTKKGDGLDAYHCGGTIKGFMKASKNRANNRPKKTNSN